MDNYPNARRKRFFYTRVRNALSKGAKEETRGKGCSTAADTLTTANDRKKRE